MSHRLIALVSGEVQGVGYRTWVRKHALRADLTGYARNLPDGSVEVVAEGREHELHQLLGCIEQGPPISMVENVDWHIETGPPTCVGFSMR